MRTPPKERPVRFKARLIKKLRIKPGDCLVIEPGLDPEFRQALGRALNQIGITGGLIIGLVPGQSLHALSEADMARHGWVRAESVKTPERAMVCPHCEGACGFGPPGDFIACVLCNGHGTVISADASRNVPLEEIDYSSAS